jgi:TonB family protein
MNLMIEYSLRATVVLTLAFAVTRMLRRQPPAFRHVIWVCAFSIAAATPVFLQFGPRIRMERSAPPATFAAASGADSGTFVSVGNSLPLTPRFRPYFNEIPFLEIVWLSGVFLVGTRVWNARRKTRALLKNAIVLKSPCGSGLPEGAESCRIAETDAVATAMTLGVFRPWILLPREHRLWEPELLRAVLLHEVAHVRRRDCLVQWLPNVVCALHWFNPLVWLARSEMLCESERACDDAVIRSGISGSAFARDLVEIARSIHSKGESLMSSAVTTKLERRIARLIDPAANRRPLTAGRTVFGAVIILAFLAPIAGVRADQSLKAPTVTVTADPVVVPPEKAPRIVAQIAQAQVTQPAPAPQSSPTGSLSGVVTDPTGAVVANATVGIQVSPETSGAAGGGRGAGPVRYSTVTGPVGQWSFPSLAAGMYTVEVQAPGFRTFSKLVSVSQGTNNQVNSNLMIGRSQESVTVTAARPNTSAASASPAVQTSSRPIRVGGNVEPAKLIRHVAPVFPQSAQAQGIQGSVTFEAIIDKAGFILNTQLVSPYAPPDFVQAALDAIKQWQYTPTLLNGEPVDALTEITVNFTLQ